MSSILNWCFGKGRDKSRPFFVLTKLGSHDNLSVFYKIDLVYVYTTEGQNRFLNISYHPKKE